MREAEAEEDGSSRKGQALHRSHSLRVRGACRTRASGTRGEGCGQGESRQDASGVLRRQRLLPRLHIRDR